VIINSGVVTVETNWNISSCCDAKFNWRHSLFF